MKCPTCGLENPPGAASCDCGHDFKRGNAAESETSEAQRQAWRELQRWAWARRLRRM